MSLLTEKTNLAGSEGTGSATVDPASREAVVAPDPEVSEQAKRRRFTAEYKLRIVREADACKGAWRRGGASASERVCTPHSFRRGVANEMRLPRWVWPQGNAAGRRKLWILE